MPAPPPGRPAAYIRALVIHYHGNIVRVLFIAAVVLLLVLTPIFGTILPGGIIFEVLSTVVLLGLAGLTSPRGRGVIIADAIVAGIGVVLIETLALELYSSDALNAFFARELVGLTFIFALYFSVKTLRAMQLHQTGKGPTPHEFDNV